MHTRSSAYAFLIMLASAAPVCAMQDVYPMRSSIEIQRSQDRPVRRDEIYLQAGSDSRTAPFVFNIYYQGGSQTLGDPLSVGWTVRFGDYCRDHSSWVQSVIIGPAGQTWRGFRVFVPAGPDRMQNWSSGSSHATGPTAVATPGLLEAVAAGGRFTIALEDDEGRHWNPAFINTLAPAERERLYAADLEALEAAPEVKQAAGKNMLQARQQSPRQLPSPPRPCADGAQQLEN